MQINVETRSHWAKYPEAVLSEHTSQHPSYVPGSPVQKSASSASLEWSLQETQGVMLTYPIHHLRGQSLRDGIASTAVRDSPPPAHSECQPQPPTLPQHGHPAKIFGQVWGPLLL
jgi:hypothetical protein